MLKSIYSDFGPYKGVNGKVGTIGGCFEYTGAPFYAAISALKTGADLSHVFCTASAAIPIKSYTPELIVHPVLKASDENPELENTQNWNPEQINNLTKWFPALKTLIIGPGLGRDPYLYEYMMPAVIAEAIAQEKLLVVDADGLNLYCKQKDVYKGYTRTILTPNEIEFRRLWEAHMEGEAPQNLSSKLDQEIKQLDPQDPSVAGVAQLSRALGNVVLKKGTVDIISDGHKTLCVSSEGCPKRSGGLGDILTGAVASIAYLAECRNIEIVDAIAQACLLVRLASLKAFREKGWSLTAPDVLNLLPSVLLESLSN